MDADDKTKYRDETSEPDVEAHKYFTEEPSEDEADKTKTKTKYGAERGNDPDERDKYRSKY